MVEKEPEITGKEKKDKHKGFFKSAIRTFKTIYKEWRDYRTRNPLGGSPSDYWKG